MAALKVSSRSVAAFTASDERILRELADFLSVTVSAAAELARATATVLGAQCDRPGGPHQAETARFVANVMSPGLIHDVETTMAVREALDRRAYRTVLQPIYDLATGEIETVEALTRFLGPPQQAPDLWFADAQAAGLGADLELAAAASALELLPRVPEHISLSVNLGPDALRSPQLRTVFAAVPKDRVIIELTEHVQINDYATVNGPLARLRASGLRLAIDDTGAGYASLSHIRRLAPEIIKLDRDLVRGIDSDEVLQALATALTAFTRGLRARVVAEGIETEAEARRLVELGVGLGQGFFLHRPAPIAAVNWSPGWQRTG